MERTGILGAALIFLVLMMELPVHASDGTKVLALGAVLLGDSPIVTILAPEPGLELTLVPTRHAFEMDPQAAQRYVRLYFPRRYDELAGYDFVLYVAAPDVRPLTASQITQLRRAAEEGVPSLADQGGISSYDSFRDAWMASGIYEIFPNDAPSVVAHGVTHSLGVSTFKISVRKDSSLPPLLTPFVPLGIERLTVSHGWYVVPKQGSTIWADMKGLFPGEGRDFPWLFSTRFGKALTWNLGDNFVSSFWSSVYEDCRNPYRTDVLVNILNYGMGKDLPRDVLLVHALRTSFGRYLEGRSFLLEVVEFADRFGANVARVYEGLEKTDSLVDRGKLDYLNQDYEATGEKVGRALAKLASLNEEAVKSRERALLWVYASEWMTTTGVSILSGYILYALMIRRRLYSSASHTSLRRR